MKVHHVFLGIPVGSDGQLSVATHRAIADLHASPHQVSVTHHGSSALTFNFNCLWCEAFNRVREGEPFDTFAMLHTDIAFEGHDWLDRLLTIFDETRADVLSVIVPIKDAHGLTSTAFDTNRWTPRRLTMSEAHGLPETLEDSPALRKRFGGPLLLNTGVMLVRLTESWAADVCFNVDNRVLRRPDGVLSPFFEPEDWKFSRWCHSRNLKLVATRTVRVGHIGSTIFQNNGPWGTLVVDTINLNHSALAAMGHVPQ